MTRRITIGIIVIITVVVFTAIVAGSIQVEADREAGTSLSAAVDEDCLTPTPGGLAPIDWVVLDGLERPIKGVGSRYVVTNETTYTATTIHSYCSAGQELAGSVGGEISPEAGQLWDLGSTDAVPPGYSGYAIVQSNQMITGTVLPLDYSPGVELEPDHTRYARAGKSVAYDHVLTNTGTTTDTYSVEVASAQGWPVGLIREGHMTPTEAFTVELGAELSVSLQVSLTVPADAAGVTETTTVTATSHLSPTVHDTATDTTVVAHTIYMPLMAKRWPPVPYAPRLDPVDNADQDNDYTVSWQEAELADTYVLEEATDAAFTDARTVYTGTDLSWSPPSPGKTPNTYYYRVRGTNDWGNGPWSNVETGVVHPLFVGLDARWDGEGYVRGDWHYDIGSHRTKEVIALVDPSTVQVNNNVWYDPNPSDLDSMEWQTTFSVSTGDFKSSSLPSDLTPRWRHPWVLPYDWAMQDGQTVVIDGEPFLVSGPYSGYTEFGQQMAYWKLVNQETILYWDVGGNWTQYVFPGDAELHYAAGPSRLLLHIDVRRINYYQGERTDNTVRYVESLTSANAFAAGAPSAESRAEQRGTVSSPRPAGSTTVPTSLAGNTW